MNSTRLPGNNVYPISRCSGKRDILERKGRGFKSSKGLKERGFRDLEQKGGVGWEDGTILRYGGRFQLVGGRE